MRTILSQARSAIRRKLQSQGPTLLNGLPGEATQQPELLNQEQLRQRARTIAAQHSAVAESGNLDTLRDPLDRNQRLLQAAQRVLLDDAHNERTVTPAAEWLLDNFHLVVDQIREIRHDLPRGYYQELPKLTSGPLIGQPRVAAIAFDLIAHTDGRLDLEVLLLFISEYQTITQLTMGELWALAIMLRFGLVDHLARLTGMILSARTARQAADTWADQLLAEQSTTHLTLGPLLVNLAARHRTIASIFVVRLLYRLQTFDGDHDTSTLMTWLEQQPALAGQSIESLIHAEHQRQAATQVAIGNTITSMRTLNAIDWNDWFERVSLVEQVLRQDPTATYPRSTFDTRDQYRHVIEQLARQSSTNEFDLARRVVDQARMAQNRGDKRHAHIGYALVDAGRKPLEQELGFRPTPKQQLQQLIQAYPTLTYLAGFAFGTAACVVVARRLLGSQATWLLALPASAITKELLDRSIAALLPPRRLPRLDLRAGIPAELRTVVVVPTLLLTKASVAGQIDTLAVLALANADPHLHFALLSDFADAPTAEMPDDAELLAIAQSQVEQLNLRYGSDRFLLLHRHRVWNPQQGCFMGWERKRGKLEEFNRLLIGDPDTTFTTIVGDTSILQHIRYVITLDADTQLPRDAARNLIGTLAHPLNQAQIDPITRRVVRGYGILQPRIGVDLQSAMASRFARLFAGNVGIDPYTTAVSDVYMDLFGEGIYAGKGIYDPVALRESLDQRFPENSLLSHDLIEGCYARVGLLSDIELIDNYPSTYAAAIARQHRWVRGDWQIAPWLLPWVPAINGITRTTLPAIARFKIFDNLRRSLLPAATVALLAAAWYGRASRAAAARASGYAVLPFALPVLLDLPGAVLAILHSPAKAMALRSQQAQLRMSGQRMLLNSSFVFDQAISNLDAIGRTLVRMLFTRRQLLEWETAAVAHQRLTESAGGIMERLLPGATLALAGAFYRRTQVARSWPAALPLIAEWLAAPALARWLDQPVHAPAEALSDLDQLFLRRLQRATWAFFAEFITAEANYLAPDNFQETPRPVVAYRTSPTNIGLQLLADLAAHDAGYIGLIELTERTKRVLVTIAQLPHANGHLLNWYDTKTLEPLPPAYVSTVDSGNLAAALLTLRQGYLELADTPVLGSWVLAGLQDTFALVQEQLGNDSQLQLRLAGLATVLAETPASCAEYRRVLQQVQQQARAITLPASAGIWLERLALQAESLLTDANTLLPEAYNDHTPPTLQQLADQLDGAAHNYARELRHQHCEIAADVLREFEGMDFAFLYDPRRRLFTIGYNLAEGRRDASYYDLLASEARLASFLAIATGTVPQQHWFALGRTLLDSGAGSVLASWSGTMFEYLMPLLFMRSYPDTLIDTTYQVAVDRQIQYGEEQQLPWGVSESAYAARDPAMNYQYRAFGVPGLGLKRGLSGELVVAPYATVLALPVRTAAAIANLKQLIDIGMQGQYGLYEAIDYTRDRVPPGTDYAIIRSYMVHHQGMSLLALANLLQENRFQQRFHAERLVQATEMLLQEKIPADAPLSQPEEAAEEKKTILLAPPTPRVVTTPTTAVPYTHLLSNGNYTVMLTNAGGGYSSSGDLAVTRWRSDPTRDNWGSFIYIRDIRSNLLWSAAYQPTCHIAQEYRVTFGLDKVELRQLVAGIETRMEVTVSPEDAVEVRRITLTNLTSAPRELELTSYAEIVLALAAADAAHPAFSNLFVETEYVASHETLLASRRPRSADVPRPWALHVTAVRGHASSSIEYETDRAAFVGRGHTTADPQALSMALSQQTGAVLDPIFSLRRRMRIVPGGSAQIVYVTGVAENREQALQLANKYRDPEAATRAFSMAWTQAQVELRHLRITADDAQRYQRLASGINYLDTQKRAAADILARNIRGQNSLWAYGISGDLPIMLVSVTNSADLSLVQELLQAHQYWRLKRLAVDLVILNEEPGGYLQLAQDQLLNLVRSSGAGAWINQRGGIFVLRSDLMPEADQILLQTVARIVLSTSRGSLSQHLRRGSERIPIAPALLARPTTIDDTRPFPALALQHTNQFGGFDPAHNEYVIDLTPEQGTPAPWSNVIANEQFGFLITERGGGYTWAGNSRENRLTPWSNDPVCDTPGEVVYLRDQTTGNLWSATPAPTGNGHIRVRHGFGYTSFSQSRGAMSSELRVSVAGTDPVKLFRLRLQNEGNEPRQLSATLYLEWVLGVFRDGMAATIITQLDAESQALLAQNPYHPEFGDQIAFMACSEPEVTISADRSSFIGRNGDLARPLALQQIGLDGRIGAGLDPCGAIQATLTLAAGEVREVVFLLGQAGSITAAHELIARYRKPEAAAQAEQDSISTWQRMLGQIQVETPQPELDVLLNGWLLYQTLVCRIWGRSAFYQSGGAYGFRDQLQDVMALTHAAPDITRAQIVRSAARQFAEGDAQHWWHPPTGRGIRSTCSDDYLWLPFVTNHYLTSTGDTTILEEQIAFLHGRPLEPGEAEYYGLPTVSDQIGSLYEHCVRAIDLALMRMGPHGLPLMGSGDWNDGMNRVEGESIWVGWFLIINLQQMAALATARSESNRAAHYLAEAKRLLSTLEAQAWDGEWYRRAYYADGTPLGSATAEECQIDSIAQSWSVIAAADNPAHTHMAMQSVWNRLVNHEAGLIKLFTPAFDQTHNDPGYIKGYLPGVRENGGQYTHAAIWAIWAYALLGDGQRVAELINLINPIRHTSSNAARYKGEPYVIAADVYASVSHTGRGGWTWYTGSAGWFYRLGIEMLLGLRRTGRILTITPCIPADWPGYTIRYRYGQTEYCICVERTMGEVIGEVRGASHITLDGVVAPSGEIELCDDQQLHHIQVRLP